MPVKILPLKKNESYGTKIATSVIFYKFAWFKNKKVKR